MKQRDSLFSKLLALAGTAYFVVVLVFSFQAVKAMSGQYEVLQNADLSNDFKEVIAYNDRMYATLGFGVEIEAANPGREEQLASFIRSSLSSLNARVFAAGLVYIMVLGAVFAYPCYYKHREKSGRHTLWSALLPVLGYLLYIGAVAGMNLANGMPFYFPKGNEFLLILAGIAASAGGSCALALLLRRVRFKKAAAVLAIPLVYFLFLFSAMFEGLLYNEPYVDSFDYVAEIDPRVTDENYTGEAYYDEEKNVVVVDGREFEPERVENPEYLRGAKRYGAYAFEVLHPFSGAGLYSILQEIGISVGASVPLLYILKGILWIVLASLAGKKSAAAG